MNPLTVTIAAGVVATVIGEALRRRLQLLTYRRPHEMSLPAPGARWWVTAAAAITVTALTARFIPSRPEVLWMLIPLALAGTWLGAVDIDVRRLPARALLPLLGWEALVTAGLFATGNSSTGLAVVGGASIALIVLWCLHWFSNGALGFGDVTLGVAVAAATTAVSAPVLFWVFFGSFTGAALWGLLTRRHTLPLGPWIGLGGVAITVLVA